MKKLKKYKEKYQERTQIPSNLGYPLPINCKKNLKKFLINKTTPVPMQHSNTKQ